MTRTREEVLREFTREARSVIVDRHAMAARIAALEAEVARVSQRAEAAERVVEAARTFVEHGTRMSLSAIAMRPHWLALYESVNANPTQEPTHE